MSMQSRMRERTGAAGKKRFEYKPTNRKFMQKHIQSRGRDFDSMFKADVGIFKPAEKENKIRLIPRTSDEMDYWALPIHVHYGVGPEEQSYLCPRKHGGGKCPVCEEFDRAKRAGKEEEAKELRPNGRYLVYLIDRKEPEKGIQIWSMPYKLDGELSKQTVDPENGQTLNIDDPSSGYDVYFTREGQGIKTQYSGVKLARKESELDDDKALRFAQKHPLPEILQVFDYDHILKEFEGGVARKESDDDEDEEDDKKTKNRGKSRDADEDDDDDDDIPYEKKDDEDEDEEDEDDDDDSSPRRRSSGKRDEDDDEDDDDSDDDDEDEEDEEEEDEKAVSVKQLRSANLATLKGIADDSDVDWKKLCIIAKKQAWDDTKLKIRLRKKIAEALDIDLT